MLHDIGISAVIHVSELCLMGLFFVIINIAIAIGQKNEWGNI